MSTPNENPDTPDTPEEEVVYFDELDLCDELLDALDAMNFEKATPIQAQAIPPALAGRDVLAVAQTGTGKTAAFLLPILDKLSREKPAGINTIILEPTRELAQQVDRQLEGYTYFMPEASSMPIYGGRDGHSMGQEQKALKTGAAIIVATPGRLMAHLDMGYADLSTVRHIVLDEADRMLDMGFVNDMIKIIDMLPKETLQTLFFSATMPGKIRKFSKEILKNPVEISIKISKPAEKIKQMAYDVPDWAKNALIEDILKEKTKTMDRVLIFCGRKKTVRELTRRLARSNPKVKDVSSDLEQNEREERLRQFRSGAIQVVVATDVLSRGIHIDGIDLVINFDVPGDAEDYVHRIGRTARAAAEGEAITLINGDDRRKFKAIEELVEMKVERLATPDHLKEERDDRGGRGGGGRSRNSDRRGGGGGRGGKNRRRDDSGGGGGGRRKGGGGGRGRKPASERTEGGGAENKSPRGEASGERSNNDRPNNENRNREKTSGDGGESRKRRGRGRSEGGDSKPDND